MRHRFFQYSKEAMVGNKILIEDRYGDRVLIVPILNQILQWRLFDEQPFSLRKRRPRMCIGPLCYMGQDEVIWALAGERQRRQSRSPIHTMRTKRDMASLIESNHTVMSLLQN
jgi:hypothetical protein